MIYIVAADQFPSCCGSHTKIRAHLSVMGDHPQDMSCGSQEKWIPEYKRAVTITGHIRTISRALDANRWRGKRNQTENQHFHCRAEVTKSRGCLIFKK